MRKVQKPRWRKRKNFRLGCCDAITWNMAEKGKMNIKKQTKKCKSQDGARDKLWIIGTSHKRCQAILWNRATAIRWTQELLLSDLVTQYLNVHEYFLSWLLRCFRWHQLKHEIDSFIKSKKARKKHRCV